MKSLNSTQKIENARSVTIIVHLFLLTGLLFLISTFPNPSLAGSKDTHDIPARQDISWKTLKFEGSKFLNTLHVSMQLGNDDLLSENVQTRPYNCQISGDNTILMIHSSTEGLAGDDGQYMEQIAFNANTLEATNRIRLSNVKEKWLKNYCWEETGVRRHKVLPKNTNEEQSPPNSWTKSSASFYSYPKNADTCTTISDPALIPYLLSTLKRDRNDEAVKVCVFGKKQLHHLIIEQQKASSLNVSYQSHSLGKKNLVKEQLFPLVYTVTPSTLDNAAENPEPFSFLGLQENITIFIDPQRGIPLRVCGKNSTIGNIELNLTEVTF